MVDKEKNKEYILINNLNFTTRETNRVSTFESDILTLDFILCKTVSTVVRCEIFTLFVKAILYLFYVL